MEEILADVARPESAVTVGGDDPTGMGADRLADALDDPGRGLQLHGPDDYHGAGKPAPPAPCPAEFSGER